YKVPQKIAIVERLRTVQANRIELGESKVDRKALPQPELSRPQMERVFVTPYDMLERQLTQIWEDVLEVKPISRQDDFFELGGHSLLAVQLFAQIEKQTGKRLPLAILSQSPTIEHLANSLRHEGVVTLAALPIEMHGKSSVSSSIKYPIAKYLPSRYYYYLRS